jgi:hypothetical protein
MHMPISIVRQYIEQHLFDEEYNIAGAPPHSSSRSCACRPQMVRRDSETIISEDCRAALAHHEADTRYTLEQVRTSLGGCVLNGTKTVVQDGAVADIVIVSARDDEAGGLSLLLLDTSLPWVTCC